MFLSKPIDGMRYQQTGTKKPSEHSAKRLSINVASELNTFTLLQLLLDRHKIALLAVGNVVLVLNWLFPTWTQFVKSIM